MRILIGSMCLLLLLWRPVWAACELDSVRISVIPKKDGATQWREYQPLLAQLQERLGVPVVWVPASSYEGVIDGLVSGGVDVAWLGPAGYALAHQRDARVEPFASLTLREGHFTPAGKFYQSLLLVRAEQFDRLSQLKQRRVVLVEPASTSGSLIPYAEFSAAVQQPLEQFFAQVSYAGSHDKALDALLERRADAAFVASVRADAYLQQGRISAHGLRALWRSEPIHYDPYVFSGHLCAEVKQMIRRAMLEDQSGLADFLKAQDASALAPVSHQDYASLLRLLQTEQP